MKNVVSYETAVRLKNAGFPQPEPEAGQLWYMIGFDTPRLAIVGLWGTVDKRPVYRYLDANTWDFPDERESTFAPTATDILRELGGDNGLFSILGGFEVWRVRVGYREEFIYRNDSPAESAAAAWLKTHEKEEGK